jgi:hypothetical protein
MRKLAFVYFTYLLMAAVLAGCSGTKAVYQQAKTPTQYAKAVLLHHNAIGSQVADLRGDPAVSESSKAALLQGYRVTVCSQEERSQDTPTASCADGPAQNLEAAAQAYESLATAQTEAELQKAVDALVGQLVTLITTVNGAK